MNEQRKWYTTSKPEDAQGLIADERTGKNIAVSYDVKDAPVIAAAPLMLAALQVAEDYLFARITKLPNNGRGTEAARIRRLMMDAIQEATPS